MLFFFLKKKKKNKGDGVQFKTKREVNVISTNIIRESISKKKKTNIIREVNAIFS
jgi:hypothetical protein